MMVSRRIQILPMALALLILGLLSNCASNRASAGTSPAAAPSPTPYLDSKKPGPRPTPPQMLAGLLATMRIVESEALSRLAREPKVTVARDLMNILNDSTNAMQALGWKSTYGGNPDCPDGSTHCMDCSCSWGTLPTICLPAASALDAGATDAQVMMALQAAMRRLEAEALSRFLHGPRPPVAADLTDILRKAHDQIRNR